MNTCRLTSSVKIAWPAPAPAVPYMLALMCVVLGFSLLSKNRACEPPWSQTMYRGIGNRSTSRSFEHQTLSIVSDERKESARTWASAGAASSSSLKFSYPSCSW
jgi:hypothetical protein